MKKLLVIDDEVKIVEAIKVILEDMGYRVQGYSDSLEGERDALANDYDLILVDLRMPGKNGAEVAESILKARPEAKVLMFTGYHLDPLGKRALDAGALSLLKKPFEIARILEFLKD